MGDSIIVEGLTAWLKTVSAWDVIIFLVIVAAIGGFIGKKAWPWAVGVAKGLVNLSQMVTAVAGLAAFITRTDGTLEDQNETLTEQERAIKSIHHETHTNNGSSIKDAVNRTERAVNEVILPRLKQLSDDIEAFRKAEVTTTVEVVTKKEAETLAAQ